jgi:hypothetical protein
LVTHQSGEQRAMSAVTLTDRELLLAEAVAARTAKIPLEQLLAGEVRRAPAAAPRLVDAAELARCSG